MNVQPTRELDSQIAVVTGSSSGIGRAIALELARAGAAVVVHGRCNEAAAEGLVEEIRQLGAAATAVMADLADPRQHEALVDRAWHWQSRVDIWVNNAGADVLTGATAGWSFDRKLEQLW